MSASTFRILQLNSARKFVGEAAHTLNLTEALRRAGHTVVLGLREGFDTHKVAVERGLDPVAFKMPSRWWPPKDVPDLRRIARIVRTEKIQVIHAHRGKDHWQAVLAAKLYRLRIPIVRTRHVTTPLRKNAGNRWQAKRTARLIAVSRAVEADVRSTELYPSDHVLLVPGGIDVERFSRKGGRDQMRAKLGIATDASVAICVARFATVKAHCNLIDAWKSVRERLPNAVLVLVGGGRLDDEVRAQVKDTKQEEAILVHGRAKSEEIPELLEAADVGTMASVGSEGFSRAVLEYMAMNLPLVATSVGALPDLITEGVNGRLVPPDNVDAMARALTDTLALSPEVRSEWGQASRTIAEAEHSYAAWSGAHARIYGQVLKENANASGKPSG